MGAALPGTAVISLGTSDTVFAAMRQPKTDPRGFGHVFGNPLGGFMCLICFSNGSLAREAVAKKVGLDWPAFERAIVSESKPGNGGDLMMPFFVPEITPRVLAPAVRLFGGDKFVGWRAPAKAARAVVEAQALSMQRHSDWIGEKPRTILVTGGASNNRGILQIVADVFQAELRTLAVKNSSALGGALRAAHALGEGSAESLFSVFSAPDPNVRITPGAGTEGVYRELSASFDEKLAELSAV
jgi:xylulokinase